MLAGTKLQNLGYTVNRLFNLSASIVWKAGRMFIFMCAMIIVHVIKF